MKVHLEPYGLFSHAMVRVARALERYAPASVTIVPNPAEADLRVLHVIGRDSLNGTDGVDRILIQYCYLSAGGSDWPEQWAQSRMVWSYYNLPKFAPKTTFNFYHAPLGIDATFEMYLSSGRGRSDRDVGVVTSGYVSHPCAEAIEEATWAAVQVHKTSVHIGPPTVEGMSRYPESWTPMFRISDKALARVYSRAQYVSGLRHVEGFEMPCIEGLACGARPILFDRPETRQWYSGHAIFVPEMHGDPLIEALRVVLARTPDPVTKDERWHVRHRFNWTQIARQFWEQALS